LANKVQRQRGNVTCDVSVSTPPGVVALTLGNRVVALSGEGSPPQGTGDCSDNACSETLFASLKVE